MLRADHYDDFLFSRSFPPFGCKIPFLSYQTIAHAKRSSDFPLRLLLAYQSKHWPSQSGRGGTHIEQVSIEHDPEGVPLLPFPGKLISDWCSSFYDDIPPSFPLDPNSPLPAAGPTGCELIRAPFTQSQSGDSILNKSALLLPVIVLLTSNSPFRAASICDSVFTAMLKVAQVPTHLYITKTAGFRGGKTTVAETVYLNNITYAMFNGRWTTSPFQLRN